jgi:hypothetical protein
MSPRRPARPGQAGAGLRRAPGARSGGPLPSRQSPGPPRQSRGSPPALAGQPDRAAAVRVPRGRTPAARPLPPAPLTAAHASRRRVPPWYAPAARCPGHAIPQRPSGPLFPGRRRSRESSRQARPARSRGTGRASGARGRPRRAPARSGWSPICTPRCPSRTRQLPVRPHPSARPCAGLPRRRRARRSARRSAGTQPGRTKVTGRWPE